MKIIDAHSHIDYITHKIQPNVVGTICCAKNESEWNLMCNMINTDNNIYGAFGIHPWFLSDVKNDFESDLKYLLALNSGYMIGEIGLDKYKPNMDKQSDVFIKQLDIAVNFKRTVFLHCVGAWDKILHLFKQYKKSELPLIVVHGFNDSENILKNLLENYNVMFSVSNIKYINMIPDDKILVETDAKQHVILSELVSKISDIKHNANMCEIIYENTLKVINNG